MIVFWYYPDDNSANKFYGDRPRDNGTNLFGMIDSVPGHGMLAASGNLDELLTWVGGRKPDVVLVHLVQEYG